MIRTQRLDLVLLGVSDLLALGSPDHRRRLWIDDPVVNPHGVLLDGAAWIQIRVLQVTADPTINPWLIRLMVRRGASEGEPGEIVGLINFHGPPDADGMLEIGCEVAAPCRRRGYAVEAAIGMATWALGDPDVRGIRASVQPDNDASLRAIEAVGFTLVGEHEHPDRGLELVYEVTGEAFAPSRSATAP
jgi:ribosomal-protein-alanine N-acetyltransferase